LSKIKSLPRGNRDRVARAGFGAISSLARVNETQ
jgi:hypothetical protein